MLQLEITRQQQYLITFNIKFMKKIRLEKPASHHSTLPHKRSSLHQAYTSKQQHRPVSPHNQNHMAGKSFFQNMKSELCTIKQDFQKLIRKEITLKPQAPLTLSNSNTKAKYCSSARKDARSVSEYESLQVGSTSKNREQFYGSILNLEKNLPCASNKQSQQGKVKTAVFSEIDVTQKKESKIVQQEVEMKAKIEKLEDELSRERNIMKKYVYDMDSLSREKDSLATELRSVKQEFSQAKQYMGQLKQQMNSLTLQNTSLKQSLQHLQRKKIQVNPEAYLAEIDSLKHHLNELCYEHNQLRNYNQQVLDDNHQLKANLNHVEQYCDEAHRRWEAVENDYRRKIDYMTRDSEEYKKRQDMFSRQIDRLRNQKAEVTYVPSAAGQEHSQLIEEINSLKVEVEHLQRQVNLEKGLHASLSQKYEEKVNSGNGITDMVVGLEKRLEQLVEENGRLKTKINFAQSRVESMNEQNRSYLEQIRLYEEREKKQTVRKQLSPTQWEQMTEQIEGLRQENKKLSQQLESKNCEKQPITSDVEKYQSPVNEELLRLTHHQIQELQSLKSQIKSLRGKCHSLEQENEQYTATQVHGVNVELEKKIQLVNSLKDVIFKVIVEKAGRKEDEEQVDHIMRELGLLRSQIV